MKFSIKDFFSKCDQIRRELRIWSHLLKKSLMENFFFCAVKVAVQQAREQIEWVYKQQRENVEIKSLLLKPSFSETRPIKKISFQ